jgi:peptidyl-prolyl cis-trans isomerase D
MALKWLRDNLRHLKFVLWGVVAVFVLLVFVDWGAGGAGGNGGGQAALQVGDRRVSEMEFLNQMRQMDQQFSRIYGERWNELRQQIDLAGQTTRYFVDRELQLAEAREVGLTVSPEELQEAILENPNFQNAEGEFVGSDTYNRIVRSYFRTSIQEFEKTLAEDIMIQKLNALAARSVWVDDREVASDYRRQRETVDLELVQLRYEPHLADVTMTDDEARAAYDESADEYYRDEQREIRYLLVNTSRLRQILPVEDQELEQYYSEHQDEFLQGEQANARHILIRVPPDADEANRQEAAARASGVAAIARNDADFAVLAAKHSEDPGTKDEGGDLGWFGRGRMVKEFEDAVFSAKPGEIVGPIRSEYGFHIIKVEGFRPAHQQPLDEVREQVRFRVLEGRASAEAEARATALAKRLQAELPATEEEWQAIADEDESVVLNRSLPFGAGEPIAGASADASLADAAFQAAEGDIRGPVMTDRGPIVWQLSAVREAGIPPFEDVQTAVEQRLRRERALDLAMQEAAKLAEKWREGGDAAELAEAVGSQLMPVEGHRRGGPIGSFGAVPTIDGAAFSSQAESVLEPQVVGDRGVVVVKVNTVNLVEDSEIEDQMESLRSRLMAERGSQLLRSIIEERRRNTAVTVDNDLLQRFAPQRS